MGPRGSSSEAVEKQWTRRWDSEYKKATRESQRTTCEPADWQPDFSTRRRALKKHQGLHKHESSLLTQIRTGKVGLRSFLFSRRVPNVMTPLCRCGRGPETATHLVLDCADLVEERAQLRRALAPANMRTRRDYAAATEGKHAVILVRWLLATGRFPEFRLARRVAAGR